LVGYLGNAELLCNILKCGPADLPSGVMLFIAELLMHMPERNTVKRTELF